MNKGSRLFRKYFQAFMAILLGSFVFFGTAILLLSIRYWIQDRLVSFSVTTKQAANEISGIYASDRAAPNVTRQELLMDLLDKSASDAGREILLFDTQGRIVACKEAVPDTLLPSPVACVRHSAMHAPQAFCAQALAGGYSRRETLEGIYESWTLLAAEPFEINGEAAGFVLAAQPVAPGLVPYIGDIFRLILISGLAALAMAFIVVYFISYRLTRPLHDMALATRQYARGEFGYRVETRGEDELRQLAEAFNSMAISLATLESSRRSFVANVSHELKTPMTSIGGFIDGMLDGTIPQAQHKKYLELVSEEVKRLSRLVTGMLNLSKIEDGELKLKQLPFDVSELLFTTVLRFEQIIERKGLKLVGLDTLEPLIIKGDSDMLTQVFYNLTDNAVKFTPQGERLEFTARREKDTFVFRLSNTGVGVASEDLARIFERFYKTDKSRSYDVKGAGLGLYLAQTIVKMHGGKISADSDGESYTQFIVELPMEGLS